MPPILGFLLQFIGPLLLRVGFFWLEKKYPKLTKTFIAQIDFVANHPNPSQAVPILNDHMALLVGNAPETVDDE